MATILGTMLEDSTTHNAKRRRLSFSQGDSQRPLHDLHNHHPFANAETEGSKTHGDSNIYISTTSELAGKAVAPFLAQHIPEQYAPLGGPAQMGGGTTQDSNSKYCYRHRPDLKCRRQANEPSMDQLQRVRNDFLTASRLEATDSAGRSLKRCPRMTNRGS